MAGKEKQKLIPFTEELTAAIEADAERCRRSFVRQVEAVLMTYYNIGNIEVDRSQLQIIGELAPRSKKKMPMLTAVAENKEEKRRAKK